MAKMLKKFVGLGPQLIKGFAHFVITTTRKPCNRVNHCPADEIWAVYESNFRSWFAVTSWPSVQFGGSGYSSVMDLFVCEALYAWV